MKSSKMLSIKILRLWLVMLLASYVLSSEDANVPHTPPAENTLLALLNQQGADTISTNGHCEVPQSNDDSRCTMDISGFSKEQADALFGKALQIMPWLKCDNSALTVLDFSKLKSLGHVNNVNIHHYPMEGNRDAFMIVNNLNLRKIEFGVLKPSGGSISPAFFTIYNNPRLSRLSIDNINSLIENAAKLAKDSDTRPMIRKKIKMQSYGECDYIFTGSDKNSLTWEEFRWCRIIQHDVVLTGDQFKPNLDTSFILHVEGTLTIKNTAITDLSMLPVYFKIKSGEISGNKLLCIGFEDEIRMKRLGFNMINNMDLSCRTDCQGGRLDLEKVKLLKDCVTLKGGLEIDGIDEATAAAELFKTVRTINGPVVIKNTKATVDFKKLKEIKYTGEEPHIKLENCLHPILFRNLTKLEGTGATHMVVLKDARIDIRKFLIKTYPGKIDDGLKKATSEATTGSAVTSQSIYSSRTKKPATVTGSRANMVDVQSTSAPEQRENRNPDDVKTTETPEATITEVRTLDPSASADGEDSNSPGDPGNSAVDGKKTSMFMVLAIVSFGIFLASSVTSAGIAKEFHIM